MTEYIQWYRRCDYQPKLILIKDLFPWFKRFLNEVAYSPYKGWSAPALVLERKLSGDKFWSWKNKSKHPCLPKRKPLTRPGKKALSRKMPRERVVISYLYPWISASPEQQSGKWRREWIEAGQVPQDDVASRDNHTYLLKWTAYSPG